MLSTTVHDTRHAPTPFSFGLPRLDELTRPPSPGQLMVISGHPGSGMSMYARTVALATAAAGRRVAFHSTTQYRDHAARSMARAWDDATSEPPVDVSGAELDLDGHPGFYAHGRDDVLIIDSLDTRCADHERRETLRGLKNVAAARALLIVVTLTETWVDPVEPQWSTRKLRDWESLADVLVALNRPEALDWNHAETGDVTVRLLRNTNGPCGEEAAMCQNSRQRLAPLIRYDGP